MPVEKLSILLMPEILPPPALENVTLAEPLTFMFDGENVPVALSVVAVSTVMSAVLPFGTASPNQFLGLHRSLSPASPVHFPGVSVTR